MPRALQLKDEGNRLFQSGDFQGAESLYSHAILSDPKNPALYSNRAMARLRMGLMDRVVSDCQTCLTLSPSSMKAFYYLSQAQCALGDHETALDCALRAHQLCVISNDKSLSAVTANVLRCKRERWEARERKRAREAQGLEEEVLELLERRPDQLLADQPYDEVEHGAIREECAEKATLLRDIFERARSASQKRGEVPEWAIDDISFGVMVDPVITKTGKSYERASIMEHLRRHPSDPLTREPLIPSELRPNLGLRQACDEYLEKNGWAVDW